MWKDREMSCLQKSCNVCPFAKMLNQDFFSTYIFLFYFRNAFNHDWSSVTNTMSMVANHSSAAATGKSQGKKANSQPPGPASKTSKSSKNASSTNNNEQGSNDSNSSSGGGGIFRPLVVLALPGVNLFRRFSQYKRLPQDPPKDRLEVELERLNNKIVSFLCTSSSTRPHLHIVGWRGRSKLLYAKKFAGLPPLDSFLARISNGKRCEFLPHIVQKWLKM